MNERKRFTCPNCGRQIEELHHFYSHLLTHNESQEGASRIIENQTRNAVQRLNEG